MADQVKQTKQSRAKKVLNKLYDIYNNRAMYPQKYSGMIILRTRRGEAVIHVGNSMGNKIYIEVWEFNTRMSSRRDGLSANRSDAILKVFPGDVDPFDIVVFINEHYPRPEINTEVDAIRTGYKSFMKMFVPSDPDKMEARDKAAHIVPNRIIHAANITPVRLDNGVVVRNDDAYMASGASVLLRMVVKYLSRSGYVKEATLVTDGSTYGLVHEVASKKEFLVDKLSGFEPLTEIDQAFISEAISNYAS